MPMMSARMRQLGTETAFEVLARANALQRQGRNVINLGIGQPDFPTPEHIVEAGRKALADGHHGYTPANGILPLREAVAADLHRRHGIDVSPERVLIVPGGKVDDVLRHHDVRRARRGNHLSQPRLPDLRERDPLLGRDAVPMRLHESKGFSFTPRRCWR